MPKQDNTGAQLLAAQRGNITSSLGEALYFDSGEHRLFGWLNRPAERQASLGMVICNPFGHELISSHRSVRAFAEAISALGVPTLRFDYAGTGDSADIDPLADQVQCWTCDVAAAVAELQRRTGVDNVCLLGFRLGALLAVLAASRCHAVRSLALIAPIVSGRRYLRELRTSRLVASLQAPTVTSDAFEVLGYQLSQASVATLAQTDLTERAPPPVGEVLVIDRKDLPSARAWTDSVCAAGARSRYVTLPGFVEMMATAAQSAKTPEEMIAATRQWVEGLPEARRVSSTQRPLVEPAATLLKLPTQARSAISEVAERPVFFGTDVVLFGIVSEPLETEVKRRAVILLSMGADHHIGANRLHVLLARQWAASGYLVMRLDLAGIGDSETRPGRPDDEVYPQAALEDIRAAVDWMRTRHGVSDVTLAGLCSGAYHALRAAVAGCPVSRILMVNPLGYFSSEVNLDALQASEVVRNPRLYRKRLLSLAAWKRLLTGKVNIWRIVKIYVQRPWLTVRSVLHDLARSLRIRLPHDLGSELQAIAGRGVQVTFVFARGEPGIDLLKLEGGSSVERLGERCRVRIIDCGDHTFSRSSDRAVLEHVLSEELCG